MTAPHESQPRTGNLPKARIEKNWKTHLIWLVPIAAAGFAGWLIYANLIAKGPTLHIYFANTQGLEGNNAQLKYRGTKVGTVKSMHLTKNQQTVDVEVSLEEAAEDLAREGTQFWIVKPEVSLGQIQGLQTIVSGAYIEVKPGPGKRRTHFQGLAEPPIIGKGLNIELLTDSAESLQQDSPIYYRGIKVGQVLGSRLGPESQTVRVTARIDEHYAPLVRENSVFWNAGGINLDLGLHGLDVRAKSLKALISGGVAFATPDNPGPPARPDTAFRLYEKPEDQWRTWAPAIKLAGK
jgi:paraquat-inducible protein B